MGMVRLTSVLVILLLGVPLCAAQEIYSVNDAARYKPTLGRVGGTLCLATIADPRSFNAIMAKETSTTTITNHIFEGLTRVNGISGEVEPHLAERWEVSPDGLTWTFHLRRDVQWSDGQPFTARDVEFTFNSLINNDDIPNSARDIFTVEGRFPEVKALDDHTVRIVMPTRYAPLLEALSQEILPRHKLERFVRERKFASAWGLDTDPREIVGTGPYMLAKYLPAQRVVLQRNPNYWRRDAAGNRLPYIAEIIYLIVQNEDVARLKFDSGEIDVYSVRGQEYYDMYQRREAGNYSIFRLGPAYGSNFLFFNLHPGKNPETGEPFVDPVKLVWFSDLRFRRAVAYAIDRPGMIKVVMNGLGYVQDGPMSPREGYFYNPNVEKYPYSPKRARELLAEAGFADRNGDGIIEDAAGNPVKFVILTNSGNKVREQIVGMIAHDLRKIGMDVKTALLEFNLLVTKLDTGVGWDAVLLGLTGGPEPHFGRNVWHSSGQLHMWHPRQKQPATPWEARIDEIFDRAVQELDRVKRKQLYDEWQLIVSQQLPLIYTVLPASIVAVRNRFGNLAPATFGGVLWNLEELYLTR